MEAKPYAGWEREQLLDCSDPESLFAAHLRKDFWSALPARRIGLADRDDRGGDCGRRWERKRGWEPRIRWSIDNKHKTCGEMLTYDIEPTRYVYRKRKYGWRRHRLEKSITLSQDLGAEYAEVEPLIRKPEESPFNYPVVFVRSSDEVDSDV